MNSRKHPRVLRLAFVFAALSPSLFPQSSGSKLLDHTKWRLVSIGPKEMPSEAPFTVTFEDRSVTISGCNNLAGRFTIDSGRLSVAGPLRSTRRACAGELEKLDDSFTKLLTNGASIRRQENQLTLAGDSDTAWVFREERLPSKEAQTRFIYVAAFTKDCTGVGPMKCLQVRDSKDKPWRLHYAGIDGFEHVPGIEYRLRIKEDHLARPPADGSSTVWYLDAVIEQSVIDRKAADDYLAAKPH